MAEMMSDSTTNLASVNYRVIENAAATRAAGKPVYTGVVSVKETYNTAAVAQRMVSEGCAVKAATIRLVLSEFAELVGKLAAEGRAVNINGLVRFAPAVRGTFASEDAAWDPAQNAIVVNASVGSRMRVAAAGSQALRVNTVVFPTMLRVVDFATARDNVITSEGTFFVMGSRLTWDRSREDEGFFLAHGVTEEKCTLIEDVIDPTCVFLKTDAVLESGTELRLTFRTRINGSFYQFPWSGEPLVAA